MALGIKKNPEGEGEYDPTPDPRHLAEAMKLKTDQTRLKPCHMLALAKRIAQESADGEDKDKEGGQIPGLGVEALSLLFASRQVPAIDQVEIWRNHHQVRLQHHGHTMSEEDREKTQRRIDEFTQAREKIRQEEAEKKRRRLHLPFSR